MVGIIFPYKNSSLLCQTIFCWKSLSFHAQCKERSSLTECPVEEKKVQSSFEHKIKRVHLVESGKQLTLCNYIIIRGEEF